MNAGAKICVQATVSPSVGQDLHQVAQVAFAFPRWWGELEVREGPRSRGNITGTADSICTGIPPSALDWHQWEPMEK